MKTEIFNLILVYGEVPESKQADYEGGQIDIMISKVLPYLRKVFDYEEVITMLSKSFKPSRYICLTSFSRQHHPSIERSLQQK